MTRVRRWGLVASGWIPVGEIALLAAIAANLFVMEVQPGWETPALHLSFVALSTGYVLAAWPRLRRVGRATAVATLVAAAYWAIEKGADHTAVEAALFSAMTVTTILRAESRRRARRVAAGVSHEILTALTVIRGHVELMNRHPASAAEMHEVSEVVIDEVERVKDYLTELDDPPG